MYNQLVHAMRNISVALRTKLEEELDRMEPEELIHPAKELTISMNIE